MSTAEPQNVILHTKRYFLCPSCKRHEFQVEHLFTDASASLDDRQVGPWQCDDCDATWEVCAHVKSGTVDVTPAPQRSWHNWDVLELSGGDAVVRLVVPGLSFEASVVRAEELERKRFYYEEHTCPTNYLTSQVLVARGDRGEWGDDDPHGLFRFVTSFDHELRSQHIRSSNETKVLAESAWKSVLRTDKEKS